MEFQYKSKGGIHSPSFRPQVQCLYPAITSFILQILSSGLIEHRYGVARACVVKIVYSGLISRHHYIS